ncbi:MAG TPA: HAD family hydrolase [Spirochaetota bacterium]|nr:HAD family hydrolase [Spirochaetota bacterium]
MKPKAILLDLDDTLILEEPLALEAFFASAELLYQSRGIDRDKFVESIRNRARELWHSLPTRPYTKRVAISSWEGLWADFTAPGPEQEQLRELKEYYQVHSWERALADFGIKDEALAHTLSNTFREERRKRHHLFDDAIPLLDTLKEKYPLALVTNGSPCLQREKIKGSGIGHYFDSITISGDLDTRKPEKEVFHAALDGVNAQPNEAVMIGNSLDSDILGANRLGIYSIWLNRYNHPNDTEIIPDAEIRSLSEIESIINH